MARKAHLLIKVAFKVRLKNKKLLHPVDKNLTVVPVLYNCQHSVRTGLVPFLRNPGSNRNGLKTRDFR